MSNLEVFDFSNERGIQFSSLFSIFTNNTDVRVPPDLILIPRVSIGDSLIDPLCYLEEMTALWALFVTFKHVLIHSEIRNFQSGTLKLTLIRMQNVPTKCWKLDQSVCLLTQLKSSFNDSRLKNPDISGAISTLSLSILILNQNFWICRGRQICQGSLIDPD